jgi:hypothetical protein
MMRDDPLDAPIPERFEPTEFYQRSLNEARAEVQRLEKLNASQRTAEGEGLKRDAIVRNQQWLAKDLVTNARLNQMIERVNEWTPPSGEHEELKTFMLQQLTTSIENTEHIERALAEAKSKAAGQFFADALTNARRRVMYSTEEQQKETQRVEGRNQWLAQLRASVPMPRPDPDRKHN